MTATIGVTLLSSSDRYGPSPPLPAVVTLPEDSNAVEVAFRRSIATHPVEWPHLVLASSMVSSKAETYFRQSRIFAHFFTFGFQ